MTEQAATENIVRQDIYNDYHRMHVLAVADQLPPAVRAEPRVAGLLGRWDALRGDEAAGRLRTGSAP